MNTLNKRIQNAVTMVRCLIAYRLGEKMLGRRPDDDYSIDLRPIYTVGNLTKKERKAVIAELSKLKLEAEVLGELGTELKP